MRAFSFSLVTAVTLMSAVTRTRQADPPAGKAPYQRVCAGCHGETAQGDQGPSLVPMTLEYDELLAKVRGGGGEMPPISKTQMTDEDVKRVHEYLKSLSSR
jgi:mono/diheme cytochrome c family protein